MGFRVYLRQAVEEGKVIFPGNPSTYGFCLECQDHADGQVYKCIQCLRSQKTPFSFACQYMNNPIDNDSVEFKQPWIRQYQLNDEIIRKLNNAPGILSIDPAVRLKETNDYSAIVVTKVLDDAFIYVVEAQQRRLSPKELIDDVFKMVALYNVKKVILETVAAQILFLDLFKQEMIKRQQFFVIDESRNSTKETKVAKIRGLIPYYANGMVLHRPGLDELEDQLIQFPRNTHDDLIDALSLQQSYWKAPIKSRTAPANDAPYWSLNWWKKQSGSGNMDSKMQRLFGDLMRK